MALNKLLMLKEDQLLKLLEDSGYLEIAIILKNKDIDGRKLLNLTEIQVRFWRLNRQQTKELLNFTALVKNNPAILTDQIKSPLNRRLAPLNMQPKLLSKSNNIAQLEFKQKLGLVLNTNSATCVPCNFSPNPERSLRPLPQMTLTYEADSRTPDQLIGKPKLRPSLPTPIEDTPLEIYENVQSKSSIDGSYLDKDELERSYVNSSLVLECSEEPRLIPASQIKSPIEIEPSKFKSTDDYFEVVDSKDAHEKSVDGYLELGDIRKPQEQLIPSRQAFVIKGSKSPTREHLKVKENKLGTFGKLFFKKKSANIQQGNYENHMVNGEVSSQEKKWNVSQKNRPLPEIPNFEKIPKKYEVKNHSLENQITTRSVKRTTDSTIKLPIISKQNSYSYQNLKESSSNEDIFKGQTEYQNFPLLEASCATFLTKPQFELDIKKNLSRKKSLPLSEFKDDQKGFYQNIPNKNSTASSDKFSNLTLERSLREAYHHERTIIRDLEKERSIDEDNEYVRVVSAIHDEKFFKNTTRQGAKELLKNRPDGAFLFRPSEKYFLVLTLRYNGKCYNLGIERTASNKIRLHADTNCISPEFENLRAFVNYFANKEAVTFKDVDNSLVEIYLKQTI